MITTYDAHSTALDVVARLDLGGQEAIVTGGVGGLGGETALALAAAGARVVLTGRDRARGEAAANRIQAAADGGPVVFRPLDLADLTAVREWTAGHNATGKPCHILVANAGVMACPLTRTPQGHELQFGTNHLGHFALVTGLLPSLRAAGGARVVVLTSSAHRRSDVDLDDPDYLRTPYDRWQAYGRSKTADALLAVELDRRFAGDGVRTDAVMPGAVHTDLQRHLSAQDRAGLAARRQPAGASAPEWKTPAQGAATSVWAAVRARPEDGGRYLEDCAVAREWAGEVAELPRGHYLPYAVDPERARALWALSERLVA
jgi:NAD(P)-dependent dehydrogenase (short-subunit alcohol dehydrogenase family)